MSIEIADIVKHQPSGETWTVAYCRGGYVCPCGWPASLAEETDCEVIAKATPEEREELLLALASIGENDTRQIYAANLLASRAEALKSLDGAGI